MEQISNASPLWLYSTTENLKITCLGAEATIAMYYDCNTRGKRSLRNAHPRLWQSSDDQVLQTGDPIATPYEDTQLAARPTSFHKIGNTLKRKYSLHTLTSIPVTAAAVSSSSWRIVALA